MNPLLQDFDTAPFEQITYDHYKPAIEKAIQIAKDEIDAIVNNPAEPTFENTTEALDFTGQKLGRITSIFFNLNSAETSKEIQEIAKEVSPWLTAFKKDMILNVKKRFYFKNDPLTKKTTFAIFFKKNSTLDLIQKKLLINFKDTLILKKKK